MIYAACHDFRRAQNRHKDKCIFFQSRKMHLSLSVSSVYSYQIYQIYFPFFESPKKKGKAEPTNKVPNKNIPPINT